MSKQKLNEMLDSLESFKKTIKEALGQEDEERHNGKEGQEDEKKTTKHEKILSALNGHSSVVASIAFSPDSKMIVSGSLDKTVRVWDMATGKQLSVLNGHSHYVTSVAFSPNGNMIASGSVDNTVRVWDI